ncbi:MAG: L-rhamnose mutarotase [Balneolaceae bacterium]|jgi:L-rhamnose mutarotase|nr:L-rhamnose mutarotase [Balneolaceae bacterium]
MMEDSELKRYCLALDLVDDPELIREYEEYHKKVWPEIEKSIRDAGVVHMDIYRIENRLFMIMETDESFCFQNKAKLDEENQVVQRWEELMSRYQQSLPGSAPGEKWRLMKMIYTLSDRPEEVN